MNFLQLVQRLRQECGVAGTGPAAVTNQVGEAKKLVDWTNSAWLEIQGLQDTWNFQRKQFSFNTVAGTGDYTPAAAGLTDLRYWHKDTFRCYKASIGVNDEQWLVEWEYQVFRNTYRFNAQVNGRPVVFAEKLADKAIMLGQKPDDVYTIVGEYQALPTALTQNTDTPAIPSHLHMIIVYKAMISYGFEQAASEVIARGEAEYQKLLAQLEREQLPAVYLGNPLA